MGRSPCCDKNGLKKGPWSPAEDLKLINYIQMHGYGNWRALPKNAGLQRCGESCRLRWTNYLRPDIKRGGFSFEEEETISQLHSILENKFCKLMEGFEEPIGNSENDQRDFLRRLGEELLAKLQEEERDSWSRLDVHKIALEAAELFRAKFGEEFGNSENDHRDLRPRLDDNNTFGNSLGGGQSTSSTALFRDLPRRICGLIDGTSRKPNLQVLPVYLAKKSKYQAPTFPIGAVESVRRSPPAAITTPVNNNPPVNSTPTSPGQVGDDVERGIIPSVPDNEQPHSNSALANQIDLEAGRTSSTSGNQPPPHDHGHAEGVEHHPLPGDHYPVEDGRDNKVEMTIMIISELLSLLDAIRAHKTSEMSHYTKGLWYTLVGSSLIGFASYWNAFFIYRLRRSSLVSKLVTGTAYAATCSALLAIIAMELPDKFNVGFYLAACAYCVPSAIFRAIK